MLNYKKKIEMLQYKIILKVLFSLKEKPYEYPKSNRITQYELVNKRISTHFELLSFYTKKKR